MIRDTVFVLVAMLVAVALFVFIVWAAEAQPRVTRIDCTWSQISPDFSDAMRQACRKARIQ